MPNPVDLGSSPWYHRRMPRVKNTTIRDRARSLELTDRDVCDALGCSRSWWRGFLGGKFPSSLPRAMLLSRLLDVPLASIWWKETAENLPEEQP